MPRAGVHLRDGGDPARARSEGRTRGLAGYLLSHLTAICVVKRTSAFTPRCGVAAASELRGVAYLVFETRFTSCNVPKSPS